jgi:hypothetical protein
MSKKKNPFILFSVVALQILFSQNAFAYLDPGTGSYIFQVLVATFIGTVQNAKFKDLIPKELTPKREASLKSKEFIKTVSVAGNDRLRIRIVTEKGQVVNVMVQYEANIAGAWRDSSLRLCSWIPSSRHDTIERQDGETAAFDSKFEGKLIGIELFKASLLFRNVFGLMGKKINQAA